MIPKNATNKPPKVSGDHQVYLARAHRTTIYWARWCSERQQWSLPYGGPHAPKPLFDSMVASGYLKWSKPGEMLHWVETADDTGSDAHLARALATGE